MSMRYPSTIEITPLGARDEQEKVAIQKSHVSRVIERCGISVSEEHALYELLNFLFDKNFDRPEKQ